jgi:NitT/TauT family transport system substrate-binding protein
MNKNAASITAGKHPVSRREFLKTTGRLGLSAAGLALFNACQGQPAISDTSKDVLETTKIRVALSVSSTCIAPLYMTEDLLKSEGFTDIEYVKIAGNLVSKTVAAGEADFSLQFSGPLIILLDANEPIKILAGVHVGCFELFGREHVSTILDLKGKSVSVTEMGGPEHVFLSSMAAYVGLDPQRDINWVPAQQAAAKQLFVDNKVDAFLAFPPTAQDLRAKKIGHVVVNSMMDRPWSQYFCCMAIAHSNYLKNYPVTTKRALRAIMKSTDICALQPERAAHFVVDSGYSPNYEYALEAMRDIPYNRWREFDPEDTLRFYSLRLHEAGMLKSSPEEIIARGADWRFLNEIKKETPQGSGVSMLPGWAGEAQAMSEHFRPASSAAKLRNLFSCFLRST